MSVLDAARVYPWNTRAFRRRGPVLYWMSRDQRWEDNWSLLYALERAEREDVPLLVAFALVPSFPGATRRAYDFMLQGLQELEERAARVGLPFQIFFTDDPPSLITGLANKHHLGEVVCDFDPLRIKKEWYSRLAAELTIPLTEVDAHNVFPCRSISPKQEYAARTLRVKMERCLEDFLAQFPPWEERWRSFPDRLKTVPPGWGQETFCCTAREGASQVRCDESVPPVKQPRPGFQAGMAWLEHFLRAGLDQYDEHRNDPNGEAQSGLSPYLHFGQISAQRAALEAAALTGRVPLKGSFFDEIIVRRELSDNFCHYGAAYDSPAAFPSWAKETLEAHRGDPRDYVYNREEWEQARTHDPLWNAAQKEMVLTGKMHGYMRMYWAKKILEWSLSYEEALATAVYLNDKYSLDGRDPNGYAGCAWSIGGLHDRPWAERPVLGKIRYMNDKGCRRKFDTIAYQERIRLWEANGV